MNPRTLILVLTVLAGAQLLALLSLSRHQRYSGQPQTVSERASPDLQTAPRSATASVGSASSPARSRADPAQPLTPSPAFHWACLESTNYLTYVANLRAFGVPEQTVRDIIVAEINKLYEAREAALKGQMASGQTNRPTLGSVRAELSARLEARRQLRLLQQEKNALLKTLLGPEAVLEAAGPDWPESVHLTTAAKVLPPDKREAVWEIELSHRLQIEALQQEWAASLGQPGPRRSGTGRLAALRQLQAQRAAQLSQVLSPAELEEYEMRASRLGAELAESLALFQPTEEEFRQIFRIRRQAEQTQTSELQPGQGADDLELKLKAALGEQRYAEYVRAQDPTYDELRRLAERYGLAQSQVDQAFDALKPLIQQAEQIEAEAELDPARQAQTLKQLKAQVDRLLIEHLGERAARSFRRHSSVFTGLLSAD
jgi:hypothetical protein